MNAIIRVMSDPVVDHWLEVLSPVGDIRVQKMMGGYCLMHDDRTFALVDDGELWLKGDKVNQQPFVEAGCTQFTYSFGEGKTGTMGYWSIPSGAGDTWDSLSKWVSLSLEAAARVVKKPKKPKKA